MISSLQGGGGPTSLEAEVEAFMPRACQRLLDSQHLESPTKSVVQPAIRQYLYGFAADPQYRSYFGSFRFPGEAPSKKSSSRRDSMATVAAAGASEDDDADEDEEDDEDREENWTLSGAQSEADSSGLSVEYLPSRKGKPCGHVFKKGESVYRCKECGLDDSCVLCAKCFKASDHQGHEVSFSMHTGGCGCCDCGDPEAWRQDVKCAFHHPEVPYPSTVSTTESTTSSIQSSSRSVPTVQAIPTELQTLIRDRISEAAAFTIYALAQFPRETTPPKDARAISKTVPRCRWNEDGDNETSSSGPWSVILWNDEKHTYQEVIETLMSGVRCSHERALGYAVSVDNYGSAIVASSTDSSKIWDVARKIGQVKLGVTVCATEDAVVLDCVGYILDWLLDMCKTRIAGDETYLCRMVAEVLLENNRIQNLLLDEDKLWKKARSTIRGILMALLVAGQDIKLQLSTAYAAVYPSIISAYLLTDREPDNSVTQFSVQLFSAPSVATHLAKQGFLVTVVDLLYAFFTQQEAPATHGQRRLHIPPEPVGGPIDPESPMFKHKKYYFLFQDLQHLLFHANVQQYVMRDEDFFNTVLNFFELFDGMNPQVRASTTHVEYETDSWVAAFNLTIHLSKMAKNVGKAFQLPCTDRESRQHYLAALYHRLLVFLKEQLPFDDENMRHVQLHTIPFNGKKWHVVDFQVSQQAVSFHHPIHLLYAEMLKNIDAWSPKAVENATGGVHKSYTSMLATLNDEDNHVALRITDEVVRVLALLAQIRAGMWVRNGFGLRAQHLHYREYTLRETTFDQDVFFMQAAFASIEPTLLLVDMIDRFELMQVMNLHGAQGAFDAGTVYDSTQATTVLEEFLYLLIVIFSEPADIEGMGAEEAVKRELIHLLLMGPYSYSEILKNITDRAREETCFDKLLAQVATFRAPDPAVVSSDVGGTYILKEEYLPEIDPYYYRYTRNQREQAMKTIKEKLKNDGIFKPRKMHPKGAFAAPQFFSLLSSSNFVELLRCSFVWATRDTEQYADMIVDLSLHLTQIALTEVFDDAATGIVLSPVLHILSNLEEIENFKEQRPRISFILDTLAHKFPDIVRNTRKRKDVSMTEEGVESQADILERKRAAAKARQAAIMQSFAAAQKNFLDTVSDDEDEEEGTEELDDAMEEVTSMNDGQAGDEFLHSGERGSKRRRKVANMGSCIVCQEALTASNPFGGLALIQTSSFIKLAQPTSLYQEEMTKMPRDWDASADAIRPFGLAGQETSDYEGRGGTSVGFPCTSTKRGLYASACGHMMHISCFDTYCQSIIVRHAQQFTRLHPENPERSEFTCPLCKSLGNVLLPVSQDDFEEEIPPPASAVGLHGDWLQSAAETASASNPQLTKALSYIASDGKGRLKHWKITGMLPQRSTMASALAVGPAERRMLERLLSVVAPLEAENRMLHPGPESKTPTIPHQLLSYTISVVEIGLRGKETGTLDGHSIPEATSQLLRSLMASLVKLVHVSARTADSIQSVRTALIWLMFGERQGDTAHMRPFLSQDPFTFLVQTAAVAPDDFYQFANLCFYAHVVRISHELCKENSQAVYAPDSPSSDDAGWMAELCMSLQEARWERHGTFIQDSARQRAATGAQHAFYHALPFLRRAAILHGVLFPAFHASSTTGDASEMTRLLKLLHITHPSELVGRRHGKSAQKMTGLSAIMDAWDAAWLSAPEGKLPSEAFKSVELEHPIIYELLGLPRSIDTLIESTVTRKCRRCRTVPTDPAICLICGDLVCQQSYCCMEPDPGFEPTHGECNTHMWKCGTSMGIYFLVKRCVLVYLYADKGAFSTAPYLDVHGEADPGFKKHRPLYLNTARYDEVRKMWMNHSIATMVARKLEAGNDPGGWATF